MNRIVKMIAALSLIVGYASCGEDSDPVSPSPEPEPVVLDFQEPVLYPVEEWAITIVASDLDTDGDNDLILAKCCGARAGILLNNGDGTFQPEEYLSIPESYITAADLDGDGDGDIVAGGYQSSLLVLVNNGDATFQSPLPLTEEPLGSVRRIAAVDLDRDGDLDLLAVIEDPDRIVTFLNNGDATFGAPILGWEGYVSASTLTISDLDQDGDSDLLCAANRSVFTSLGNGDGTFSDAVYHSFLMWEVLGVSFDFCVPLDIDGDGDIDIAAGSRFRGTYILLNAGDLTFDMAACYAEPQGLRLGVATDVDSDGYRDIVASRYEIDSVTVFQNPEVSGFQSFASYYAGIALRSFVLTDFDGDGDIDIAGHDFHNVSIMLSTLNDRDQ